MLLSLKLLWQIDKTYHGHLEHFFSEIKFTEFDTLFASKKGTEHIPKTATFSKKN